MNKIIINNTEVKPGTKKTVMLSMPNLYDWTPLSMPVHVIHGKNKGPTLCLTAAIHGDEVNGVEIIRRLLKKVHIRKLCGTIIAIPIVNVYGFLYQDRYLMDRRDLNRCFPGVKKGSLASRICYLISNEILTKVDYLIDLHTGSLHRTNLPQIRTNIDSPKLKSLAEAFGVPIILHSKERDGSLRQTANDINIPCLLYEAGEALRFDELSIRMGINGILNIMRELDMMAGKIHKIKHIVPEYARSSFWVRAHHSGILRPFKMLGKRVKENDTLAIIANPTSNEEHKLYAPSEGIIIGVTNLPLVHEGAALFHIASFTEIKKIEEKIEAFHGSFLED